MTTLARIKLEMCVAGNFYRSIKGGGGFCQSVLHEYFGFPSNAKYLDIVVHSRKVRNSYKVKYKKNDGVRFLDIKTEPRRFETTTATADREINQYFPQLINKTVYITVEV